jgi:hypothetical protein
MYLQEIFDQLTYGELSQLSMGGGAAGVIDETNYPRVLTHINLGLTALYKRFNLKEKRLAIALQPDVDTYLLNVVDILKIERILTDAEFELPLNHEGDAYSCFTPTLTTLHIPKVLMKQGPSLPDEYKTHGLTVVYRADHPKIANKFGMLQPETKHVELPSSHLQALLYYVASRAHNPIGMTGEFNSGNNWYAKYEAECRDLETQGLQVDRGIDNNRLRRNGFP